MTKLVINGAKLKCSRGTAPATLAVPPANGSNADDQPTATVIDHLPVVGMCQAPSNPRVAAATAAAMGTPMPCVPVLPAPWSPGTALVVINGQNALTADSKCTCAWSGGIEITDPATAVEAA